MTSASLRHASTILPDPAKIVVPVKHAQILIEPPLAILQASLKNRLAGEESQPGHEASTFCGIPFEQLRTSARRQLLDAANDWAGQIKAPLLPAGAAARPWILTGHQVELYHAGVWAKVIVAAELARRTHGIAFDLLVDHDVIDHRGFDVPVQTGTAWKRTPIHWAAPSHIPADALPAPTPEQFEQWDVALAGHPQTHTDTLAFLLAALRPTEANIPYLPWLSRARAQLERALDVDVHHIPTGLLCSGETWRTFVLAWISNADAWTNRYNAHLAAYRQRLGIKNAHHPMPDLARTSKGGVTTYELPFWIYLKGEPRQRLFVRKTSAGVSIIFNNDEIDPTLVMGHWSLFIRPRALTLTMYVRLFLADLFIHGIGGALYDQITDALLADLFHMTPPYACVSAAWLLPLGQPLENGTDIPALQSQRHHILHNPQQALDPFTALKTEVTARIRDRQELLARINESLATTRRDQAAARERHEWFEKLHTINADLHTRSPKILAELDAHIADALRAREQNKVLLWREYFFGLHTMDSLRQLIAKVRAN